MKFRIKQTMVLTVSCIVTVVIGTSILFMISNDNMPETAGVEMNATVQERDREPRRSGPKYTLQEPEEKIEINTTSAVTEETDTQKSNRLENIMNVLSTETE